MKQFLLVVCLLLCGFIYTQPNTEIYLFDLEIAEGEPKLSNKINISNNDGYDNQPSFFDDTTVIFSATRNGQTDIRSYDIVTGQTKWLTDTPEGSEYSPTRIPGSDALSAIRLDTNGLQRLYRYDTGRGISNLIRKDAKVGYHLWYSEDLLLSTVLMENGMDLVVSNLEDASDFTFQKQVGRSLLRIPNTKDISFLDFSEQGAMLKAMDPISGATRPIIRPDGAQDFCWLPDGTLLTGRGNRILAYHPDRDTNWQVTMQFADPDLHNITRIAINTIGTKLAIVAEASPETIVSEQVATYNARDLEGFVSCYAENVLVQRFPKDTLYIGREQMRKNYGSYFQQTKSTSVAVEKRIVIGNTVIDEEKALDNGAETHQVAIYQIRNGKIASMSFLFENKNVTNPITIVDTQLEAYNARDIDAFLATYSDAVQLFNYPATAIGERQEQMRKMYQGFFEKTPDLNCEIKKRIVIGNTVIDQEYLTINGQNYSAVALYEVEEGKIARVTFIQ
ncbi:MAG: nuclear transport factor 2 family protein [Bacteroidota bacterium]